MSFNIHHAAGSDGVLDLARIAGIVRDHDAEVIGLQEVDRHWSERSEFVDQAAALAGMLDMHVTYGANLDLDPLEPGQPRRQYGTAILSRYPILESGNTFLPNAAGKEQRGLLYAKVVVRGVRVNVYNTHLQHDSQPLRAEQAVAVRNLIAGRGGLSLLMGDMNATPEAPEITHLTALLVDTWTEGGVGPGYTYDATNPTKRIDYVFSSPEITIDRATVVATNASDHLPVVVEVRLPGSHVGN
jgi:endonuclease/exonuclease/phosphatase family metal-dependent hydrolase